MQPSEDHARDLSQRPLAGIGWPALVAAMLLGHVMLMMFALTLARTISAATEPVSPAVASIQEADRG